MAIYKDIIKVLGDTIVEYNAGAWALFRDQMVTEIGSQFIFGNGRKPDESLLEYSIPNIRRSNRIVKGQQSLENGVPRAKFTYYTNDGTKTELGGSGVTIVNPESDTLHIDTDHTITINDKDLHENKVSSKKMIGIYDEDGLFNGKTKYGELDGKEYYTDLTKYKDGETLLSKTLRWFRGEGEEYIKKRFQTTISRFHTDKSQEALAEYDNSIGLQARTSYGLSHGRNLLKKNPKESGDSVYEDPYCRVWKWHKQYHSLKDTIRPFRSGNKTLKQSDLNNTYYWSAFRSNGSNGFSDGGVRLGQRGVMYDNKGDTNGLVNITPSHGEGGNMVVSVEHCMFSIENLAWKGTYGTWGSLDSNMDENGLSREQKGPLGGRIMWFPPYDIKFNETSQANWQTNEFIGRGEPIYTYANTTRSGTLSFKLLIDHPAILDYWEWHGKQKKESDGSDGLDSKEQQMLRFFAGCEILKANKVQIVKKEQDKKKDEEGPIEGEVDKIRFKVYFPNNYSGQSDRAFYLSYPIFYIMNGVGTNKFTYNKFEEDIIYFDTTKWVAKEDENSELVRVGGYEINQNNIGVSIIKDVNGNDTICTVSGITQNVSSYELTKIKSTHYNSKTKDGREKAYCYRVDDWDQVLDDKFKKNSSYVDTNSYALNSTGYAQGIDPNTNSDLWFSLTDFFMATSNRFNLEEYKAVYANLYDEERVKTLANILQERKIKHIKCIGRASKHGNKTTNKELARQRETTVREWLKQELRLDKKIFEEASDTDNDDSYKNKDSSYEDAKLNRYCLVEIELENSATEDASEGQVSIGANEQKEGDTRNKSTEQTKEEPKSNDKGNENSFKSSSSSVRYDDEYKFFKKLTLNEPFMARLLSERINNFDPVFHSMSPEGFNARLTFLNQCMRQGPTTNNNNNKTFNANNLAFGRPPVCVLRIGDFYNTKIVITSMNIDYDPLVWDLNEEGIGVMPMIANVSLSFNFIGGSELGGPIQRLQNATSFNYYANASVYDNRAEEIDYEGGKPKQFKAYEPK